MPKCSNKILITIQIHAHALGLSYSVCKGDDALGPVDGPWQAVYSANRSRAGSRLPAQNPIRTRREPSVETS